MDLKQAVVFCILMETDGGIVTKHPFYILEKLEACQRSFKEDELLALLDKYNQEKYQQWKRFWGIQ